MTTGSPPRGVIAGVSMRTDCARNMVIDYELDRPVSIELMRALVPAGLVVSDFSVRVAGASDHAAGQLAGDYARVSAVIGSHSLTVAFGCLVQRASPEAVQRFEEDLIRASGTERFDRTARAEASRPH